MFLFGNKSLLPPLRVQWVLGALVAMLPLLAGMFYAINIMDEHNKAQGRLVLISAKVAASGVSLSDQAKDLERVARQYHLLKDERFKGVFEQKHSDMVDQLDGLASILTLKGPIAMLDSLRRLLGDIDVLVLSDSTTAEQIADIYKQLHQQIKSLNVGTSQMLQTQLDDLEDRYQDSQWRLMVMGAWVLPGTLILVWLVSVMVLRPIYQLSAAIQRMGKGDWRSDIHITGSNEMVLLGENLSRMQSQLRSIEAHKYAFLQQITHELKTPLAAIMEAGSLMADEVPGKLNGSQRQVLTILQDNANSLQTLIQQLLDYNSAAKDHLQELEMIDIQPFLEEKLTDIKGLAQTRNVKLILQGESLKLLIDAVRMSMIVRNLVSNAVQLTPSGKQVLVTWGEDSGGWCFKVSDEGPGVAEDEKERIFEPFYQGGAKRQGSLKGSGIGLAIVKECTEFMGGSVEVEGSDTKSDRAAQVGACFSVRLPTNSNIQEEKPLLAQEDIGVNA